MALFSKEPAPAPRPETPPERPTQPASRATAPSSAPTSPSTARSPAPSRCVIEGTVRGKINMRGDLRVGTKARVEATVHAQNVTVEGKLTGDISADDRVELVASATVDGNIKAPKIVVAEGAKFRGSVDMGSARPKEEPAPAKAK